MREEEAEGEEEAALAVMGQERLLSLVSYSEESPCSINTAEKDMKIFWEYAFCFEYGIRTWICDAISTYKLCLEPL